MTLVGPCNGHYPTKDTSEYITNDPNFTFLNHCTAHKTCPGELTNKNNNAQPKSQPFSISTTYTKAKSTSSFLFARVHFYPSSRSSSPRLIGGGGGPSNSQSNCCIKLHAKDKRKPKYT